MESSLIKKEICSIEQAKKLFDLGLLQRSLFYYVNNWRGPRKNEINDGEHIILGQEKLLTRKKGRERETEVEFVSAYTETELKAFLPYGKSTISFNIDDLATLIINILEGEGMFMADDYNENFKEFFEIEEETEL